MEELNRDILLQFAQTLTVNELSASLDKAIDGIAVVDINNKRIVFQDKLTAIMGPAASEEMYLETYYQLIPDYERNSVSLQYKEAIRSLLSGEADSVKLRHAIKPTPVSERKDIEITFQSDVVDGVKYLVGLISEVSADVSKRSYSQLMAGDIDAYLFTYDIIDDRLFVSLKFVEAFDLPENKLDNFTQNVSKYMYPEDVEYLNQVFAQYLNTHFMEKGQIIRFLSPARGDLYLMLDGVSDKSFDSDVEDGRYISGVLTDVTNQIANDAQLNAYRAATDDIRFIVDINRETLSFSENIDLIFPNARREITGDFVEEIAHSIITEDRKRFRNAMHRAVNDPNSQLSVEFRIRPKHGSVIWVACRAKTYYDSVRNGNVLVGTIFNLTKLNEVKEIIERKEASNDITGLPTRDKLMNDMSSIIRNPDVLSCGLVLIDISEFHLFNDNYGRDAGNSVLSAVAAFVSDRLPEGAVLYHIGVDIFAMLWREASRKNVMDFIEGLISANNSAMITPEGDFFVSLNIAASMYPEGDTADDLFGNAEIALHKSKSDKTVKYAVYSPADKLALSQKVDFVSQITSCIMNKMENFQLFYQPLIDARTGRLAGAEALLRWQSNQGELVNPELVVKALEAADRMADVGRWIANEAIKQCAKWISKGAPKDFYIHINATADDLIRPDYAGEIMELLKKYNLSPDNILIELTETSLMENMAKCRKNLIELSSSGIRTALDDFGSGYSSFNYLKELPVDEIKIDKTFTDDMETVEFNASFIEAMTMLAHSINKSVVVEGVERESQANKLREMGADIFQGYLYGKPMSVFAFWTKFFG